MTYPDESRYEGEFKHGKRNGRGKLFLAEGKEYEGDFRDDKPNGIGIVTVDGTVYRGEIEEGFSPRKRIFHLWRWVTIPRTLETWQKAWTWRCLRRKTNPCDSKGYGLTTLPYLTPLYHQ